MNVFDTTFLIAAVPAVLIAGVSKAGFGSGASFVSVTILALALPPEQALGLMLPLLMVIDLASLRPYWRRWNVMDSKGLILAAVPGVGLGALLLSLVDAKGLKLLIGAISLIFVAHQLWPKRARANGPLAWGWGAIAGAIAGFTSFVSHAGGPITAMYLLRQGRSKTEYQATTVIVFFAINLMKLVIYVPSGMIRAEDLLPVALLIPVALLGTWLGVRAHQWVPQRAYFAVTYTLLVLTGGKLILDGLA